MTADETLPPEVPFEFEQEQDAELAGLPPEQADAVIEETLEESATREAAEVGILDADPNIAGDVDEAE